ncbi:hypothetical protein TIFTF001_040786 [Ficus carica]|uniref:Pentatricopeptide repeat-containing protein n=1 Tax=Ficus carica TaxID=3494 RepID=A0AA88CQF8_FICCA|nr:hypothetical protein TIFTF001_040786 [Ficus carica]
MDSMLIKNPSVDSDVSRESLNELQYWITKRTQTPDVSDYLVSSIICELSLVEREWGSVANVGVGRRGRSGLGGGGSIAGVGGEVAGVGEREYWHLPTSRFHQKTVFTLPNWRPSTNSNNNDSSKKNEHRSKELRLNDAFLYFESMVLDKGQKPDAAQATQLLYDICKANKLRKAVRLMEMMVSFGIIPGAASYTFLVSNLCRRGNIGHAMQLVEKMDEYGYLTNT